MTPQQVLQAADGINLYKTASAMLGALTGADTDASIVVESVEDGEQVRRQLAVPKDLASHVLQHIRKEMEKRLAELGVQRGNG